MGSDRSLRPGRRVISSLPRCNFYMTFIQPQNTSMAYPRPSHALCIARSCGLPTQARMCVKGRSKYLLVGCFGCGLAPRVLAWVLSVPISAIVNIISEPRCLQQLLLEAQKKSIQKAHHSSNTLQQLGLEAHMTGFEHHDHENLA